MIAELIALGALGTWILKDEVKSTKKVINHTKLATGQINNSFELLELQGTDGIRLSDNVMLSRKSSFENVLLLAPVGSGKSTRLFFKNLLDTNLKGSIIVSDPKGELYNTTKKYQKSIGRRVIYFNPLQPDKSLKYNPLSECKDTTEVSQLAETILTNGARSMELQTGTKSGGVEWLNMGMPLLCASLLYCKSKGYPVDNITSAVRLIINHTMEELDALFLTCDEEVQEQYNIFKMVAESERTASSIKISITANLRLFLDKNIEEVTKKTEFNTEDLRNTRTCMYICYSDVKANYVSPIMAVIYSQIINKLMESKGLDVHLLLDEFANIGVINSFSNIISTSRSRCLSFLICLQSISQLEGNYGIQAAYTILNNLKSKCILSGLSDIKSLNYISELLGETQIAMESTSKTNKNTTTNKSYQRRKLLTSDEIRRISTTDILIIAGNKQPIIDKSTPYFQEDKYLKRVM